MEPHELSDEEMLLAKIEELRRDREQLSGGDTWRHASAVATMHNSEIKLLKELRQLRAEKVEVIENPCEQMTDAEIIDDICRMIRDFPDDALEKLDLAMAQRRTGRLRSLVE